MARDFKIRARFVAEDKASATISKVEGRFKKLGSTVKSTSLAQVAALGGVAVALRKLTQFAGDSIEKSNIQAVAVNDLRAALADLGAETDSVAASLIDQAAALQKSTTFGDEAIIQAQTMIASFVKNEEQIKAATAATLDFAKANGIDLQNAAALVAKTLGSSTNALTRYGVEVEGAVGSTERLESAVENITKRFGGRAAAATLTYKGATEQLSNAFGDLQEKLADNLTQNEDVIKSMNDMTAALSAAGPGVVVWSARVLELTSAMGRIAGATTSAAGFVGLFTEEMIEAAAAGEDLRVNQDAVAATAKRLGVTVDTLNAALANGTTAQLAEAAAALEADAAFNKQGKAADDLNEKLKELAKTAADETAEAMNQLADAMGVVTSVELQEDLTEMEANLETVRNSAFGVTQEFRTWESGVVAQIERTRDRIASLRSGMGDLTTEIVENTTPAFDEYIESLDGTNTELERQRVLTRGLIEDNARLTESTNRLVASQGGTRFAPSRSLELRDRADFSLSPFGQGGTFTTVKRVTLDENGNPIA